MSAARICVVMLGMTAAGCGPKGVPVKGLVTLDDKPLPNAAVLFVAQEAGGRDATGFTDAAGVFEMNGVLPGSYKVTIHCSEAVDAPAGATSPADVQRAKSRVRADAVMILPIYSQPDQTVLSQRVPPEGEVRFDLKSKR
jgi:hypothetical protein